MSYLQTCFEMVDVDGEGEITPEQLEAALESLGDLATEKEIRETVRAADVNGDGTIQFEEFVEACIEGRLLDSEKIKEMAFLLLDQSIAKQEKELKPNNSLVGSLVSGDLDNFLEDEEAKGMSE